MKQVAQGQLVWLRFKFRNQAGTLTDPSTIRVRVKQDADGAVQTYNYDAAESSSSSSDDDRFIDRISTGVYMIGLDTGLYESGVWRWRVKATGPAYAKQGQFYVEPADPEESSSSS